MPQVTLSVQFPNDIAYTTKGCLRVFPPERLYENLEADEKVILFIGRHWVTIIRSYILTGLLLLLPFAALATFFFFPLTPLGLRYLIIGLWFWYCGTFYFFIKQRYNWRSDVYIITNERIIDFAIVGVFFKKAVDIDLDAIHEVSHQSGGGIIRGGIDYGDVTIRGTGKLEVRMKNIPMPSKIALAIGEMIESRRASESPPPAPAATQTETKL